MHTLFKKTLLWTAMAVFTLLVSELVLRFAVLAVPGAAPLLAPHRLADATLGWRFNPRYPDIDAKGFRNPGIPQRADWVALGDSQTYGYGVAPDQSWPRQLAARSGLGGYTLAGSGYGPGHSLLVWDEAMALAPRHAIVALYSGNDAYDTFQLVHGRGQLAALRSTDPQTLDAIAAAQKSAPLADRARRITRMGRPVWPLRDTVRQHSRLYSLLRSLGNRSSALSQTASAAPHWDQVEAYSRRHSDYIQLFDDGRLRTAFTVPKRLIALDLDDPRIREGHRQALEALTAMQRRAIAEGIAYTVLLIPTKEFVFAERVKKWTQAGNIIDPAYQRLIAQEGRFWAATRLFLEKNAIPHYDALPALRRCLDQDQNPYRISADGHPNALGYEKIAALLTAHLTASIPPAP